MPSTLAVGAQKRVLVAAGYWAAALTRPRSFLLKAKAADKPRAGRGPGTDIGAFIIRPVDPAVKSRNVGKAVESAASTKGEMSRRLKAVTPDRPKSDEKEYSVIPSDVRSLAIREPPT
jgi:hypothetical protein